MGRSCSSSSKVLKKGSRKSKKTTSKKIGNKRLYQPHDSILVLGDGDFSFSRGLVRHRSTGKLGYATSYDSGSMVRQKYKNAAECIADIEKEKGIVLHDIDATKLDETIPTFTLKNHPIPQLFQYIIFNFPHSGHQRVHVNRNLLRDFFRSARDKLVHTGEVHVALKTKPPYSNWLIEEQARTSGFVLKERRQFRSSCFPGYHHRTTDPLAKFFEAESCLTYIFVVDRSKHKVPKLRPVPAIAHESTTNLVQDIAETKPEKKKEQTQKKHKAGQELPPKAATFVVRAVRVEMWRPTHKAFRHCF